MGVLAYQPTGAEADARQFRRIDDANAEEKYAHAAVAAVGTRQRTYESARRTRDIALQTNYHIWLQNDDTAARDAADLLAVDAFVAGERGNDRSYREAELLASADLLGDQAMARYTFVATTQPSIMYYLAEAARADEVLIVAEAETVRTRDVALAEALADFDLTESSTFADALATSHPSPWATYDAAIAEAVAERTASVAPAELALAIAEATAEENFTEDRAVAQSEAAISVADAHVKLALALAETDHAQDQATASAMRTAAPAGIAIEHTASFNGNGAADGGNAVSITTLRLEGSPITDAGAAQMGGLQVWLFKT